jgi:EpsI family protein
MSLSRRAIVLTALMLLTSWYLSTAPGAEAVTARTGLQAFPLDIDSWRGRNEPDFSKQIVAILGVDDYIFRTYRQAGQPALGLYVGYHDSQRQGDTIHSPLNCLPGAGWQPASKGRTVLEVQGAGGRRSIEINRYVIERGLDRQLVLYWYQSHGRVVASEYWGKVYTVVDAVRLNRTDAALVRVITTIPEATAEAERAAEARAAAFVKTIFPLLGPHLPQ